MGRVVSFVRLIIGIMLVPILSINYAHGAAYTWNGELTTSGGDATGSVGTVGITITDLDDGVIEADAGTSSNTLTYYTAGTLGSYGLSDMYSPTNIPSQYLMTSGTVLMDHQGHSYKITYASPQDYPLIAISSLGNQSLNNRFTFDKINGATGGTVNILWQGNRSGSNWNQTPGTFDTNKGDETTSGSLTGVTYYEAYEGNFVARINATNVTTIEFSLQDPEWDLTAAPQQKGWMTVAVGYGGGPSAVDSTLTASPNSVPADGSTASTLTVQVKDADGNAFTTGGETVVIATDMGTISNTTDNGDGTYTATISSSSTGTANITATVNGSNVTTTTVTFTNPPLVTDWVDWTIPANNSANYPYTTTNTGTTYDYRDGVNGTINDPNNGSAQLSVQLSGEVLELSADSTSGVNWVNGGETTSDAYDVGTVSSPEGEDRIGQTGYTQQQYKDHTINFPSAVDGVVMAVWSLGSPSTISEMLFSEDFIIIDTENSGAMTKSVTPQGYKLSGYGGAGIIQFCRSGVTSIQYTVTAPEIYSGMNVGLTTNALSSGQTSACGSPKSIDVTAPTLTSSSPADDDTNVALGSNITLTFSETVVDAGGTITLKKSSDNSTVQSFTGYSVSGNTVTLNPTNNLAFSTGYYVEIGSTAVKDATGNTYAGLTGATSLNFTTVSADSTAPTVVITAASSAGAVASGSSTNDASLTLTFTLSEVDGSSPNDFVASDISVTNATLGNDFACTGLVCTVTLTPSAAGLVTVDVAAAKFKDVAGNDNTAASQFTWTYGSDPTEKEDVIKTVEMDTTKAVEFTRQSFRAVNTRFQWLKANSNPAMRSHQGVRFNFADPYINELINGRSSGFEPVTLNDVASKLRSYGSANGDVAKVDVQAEIEDNATRLALGEVRNQLGTPDLNPTGGAVAGEWALWTEGQITIGEFFKDSDTAKQTSEGYALTIGMDKPYKETGVIGGAITFGKDNTDIGSAGSNVETDSYSLSLYTGFETKAQIPVEFTLGTGNMGFDNTRVDGAQTLTGQRDGQVLFASAKMYKDNIKKGDFDFNPYGLLETSRIWMKDYQETGGNLALDYDQQIIDQTMLSFGADMNYQTYYANGRLVPFGTVEVGADLSGSSDAVMRYVGQTQDYRLRMDRLSDYHWLLRAGFDYTLTELLTASLSIERYEAVGAGHADTFRLKLSSHH